MAARSESVVRTGNGAMSRNCKHCNGIIKMRKRTKALYMGNCSKCKRTYALFGPAVASIARGLKIAA